ncbi:MAG: putative DNA binding domain-containing protein [Verrucomicrobiota bacterium]|nr:putative DNA binding domain-containing protein [Verrucomicrobiota bacterium]
MIEELLQQEEGKTLEFKENSKGLDRIIHTIIAFANTAGGKILIGVKDKTKEIVGLQDPIEEEMRLANAIADSIEPLFCPDIHVVSWRNKEFLLIQVPHSIGPYYAKSRGLKKGTYIRLGSTNRLADAAILAELERLGENECFDEMQASGCSIKDLDLEAIKACFKKAGKQFVESTAFSLHLYLKKQSKSTPSKGAILLFGKNRKEIFPHAIVRCVRFSGTTKDEVLDQQNIDDYLPLALDKIITFVQRNTKLGAEIGPSIRKNIAEYPPVVVKEAVTNALIHTDYSAVGSQTQIAIFDDRIEITNPGALPFGLNMEDALQGISQLRNRVIGRCFRELELIELWGSGLKRMIFQCQKSGIAIPKFEELGHFFRATLFNRREAALMIRGWRKDLSDLIAKRKEITTKDAATFWKISDRAARVRLKKMVEEGIISEISTHTFDPQKKFVLK